MDTILCIQQLRPAHTIFVFLITYSLFSLLSLIVISATVMNTLDGDYTVVAAPVLDYIQTKVFTVYVIKRIAPGT